MNWLKDKLTSGLSKKTIMAVFILAAVDVLSMASPFYLKYVISDIHTYLNITQADFDQLNAVLGYVLLAMQLPSGWIADRLSGKKILTISVIMTGILTVLFGLVAQGIFASASLTILYIIFVGFGISTTLFLWSPLWKVLSNQGSAKEQSKLYGLEGSYGGLVGLLVITLIGTIATEMSKQGNDILFYVLVYLIAGLLLLSSLGTWFFIKDTNEKSTLLLVLKNWWNEHHQKSKSKKSSNYKGKKRHQFWTLRVLLLAIFVMGMYMFQSIFAYYLKDYVAMVVSATVVTVIAGFRSYGLRLIVSAPYGNWITKRRSWIFVCVIIIFILILVALVAIFASGIGNQLTSESSKALIIALQIILPTSFLLIGTGTWLLTASRFTLISEIPHTNSNYGSIVAFVSFIAFSSDAWFYQMAASWMQASGHIMDATDVQELGYGSVGGYDQAGIQLLLIVAVSIGIVGALAGLGIFLINKKELRDLNKTSYRWRDEKTIKITAKKTQNP